jgi:hypothetical protein
MGSAPKSTFTEDPLSQSTVAIPRYPVAQPISTQMIRVGYRGITGRRMKGDGYGDKTQSVRQPKRETVKIGISVGRFKEDRWLCR